MSAKTGGILLPITMLAIGVLVLLLAALVLWLYFAKGGPSELGYTNVEPNAAMDMVNRDDNLVILDC